MAIKLFSILRRKLTKHDELLDNDLQTLANAIDNIPSGGVKSVNDNGLGSVVTVDNADPVNPIVEFNGVYVDGTTVTGNGATPGLALSAPFQIPSVDGTTVTGDGTVGNPLVAAFQSPSVDGVTITGDGTPGNPLVAVGGGGGGAVSYANVFFVDAVNGNNATGAAGDFTKPYLWIYNAINAANAIAPTATNRALVYVRAGYHVDLGGSNIMYIKNYVDIYMEPGTVIDNGIINDLGSSVECKIFGKAAFESMIYSNKIFTVTGASNVTFEFDSIRCRGAAIEVNGSASATISGRYIYSETSGSSFGATFRGSGTIVLNISQEFAAWHNVIAMRFFSGKCYVNCPRLYLHEGNITGGNFKSVIHVYDNSAGELIVNGNLIVNSIAGYYGGTSGAITRWVDSNLTLTLNGNIYAENQFGIYGLGTSTGSKTIINGNVKTKNLVTYTASNSIVVFKNGTLLNENTTTGSEGYPVVSVGGSGKVWVENCHVHSLGLGATYPNIAAFWKDTTTATLNVYNSVHSGADAPGFFIRNSAPGQPVNNVRILNCRATKPLDTNITDLLSPTGFTQDANVQSINFI